MVCRELYEYVTASQGGTWTDKSGLSVLETLMLNVYGFEEMFWALETATMREIKMGWQNILIKGGRGGEEDVFEAFGKKSKKTIEQRRIDHIIDCLDVLHVEG